jgi:hypothetical protein
VAGLGGGIFSFRTYIRTQLTFEYITLVGFGLALDEVFQVECLLFLRHLPHNLIEPGCFLADGRVLNFLSNKKLKGHRVPFLLENSYLVAATVSSRVFIVRLVSGDFPSGEDLLIYLGVAVLGAVRIALAT